MSGCDFLLPHQFMPRDMEKCRKWFRDRYHRKKSSILPRMAAHRRGKVIKFMMAIAHRMKCSKCGMDDWACLEFHHRDRSTKLGNVSAMAKLMKFETVMAEADKCDVLCCNCHRRHHQGEYFDKLKLEVLPPASA